MSIFCVIYLKPFACAESHPTRTKLTIRQMETYLKPFYHFPSAITFTKMFCVLDVSVILSQAQILTVETVLEWTLEAMFYPYIQ